MNRLRHRTTVLSGAALGLIAGAAVYGAVASSASAPTSTAFKPAKAIVAAAPVPAANCAAGQKLEKGFCIVHVVRTVVAFAPSATNGHAPTIVAVRGGSPSRAPKASSAAQPSHGGEPSSAPSAPSNTETESGDHEVEAGAKTAAPLSAKDAAALAAKNAAALAAKDAATLGANNPATLAANKAATLAANKAATLAANNDG